MDWRWFDGVAVVKRGLIARARELDQLILRLSSNGSHLHSSTADSFT